MKHIVDFGSTHDDTGLPLHEPTRQETAKCFLCNDGLIDSEQVEVELVKYEKDYDKASAQTPEKHIICDFCNVKLSDNDRVQYKGYEKI